MFCLSLRRVHWTQMLCLSLRRVHWARMLLATLRFQRRKRLQGDTLRQATTEERADDKVTNVPRFALFH